MLTFEGRSTYGTIKTAVIIAAACLGAFSVVLGPPTAAPAQAGRDLPCGAAADMLTKGFDFYEQGRYELALPAFECALRSDNDLQKLYANFYLARIYSDDTGGFTDHPRAYEIFRTISDAVDTVDPEDGRRAPFVAKALTAFAGYVRRGIPEIGLKPDLARNVEYIRHAATFFNEPDAQFELAKLHLTGNGVPLDVPLGMHYIQKLVQDGHASAQAYLADLYWRGTHVRVDRPRALALIKTAIGNAPSGDRLWIEDDYQNIYCATPAAERQQAANLAEAFRHGFGHSLSANNGRSVQMHSVPTPMGLGRRDPAPAGRRCATGEPIDMELRGALDPQLGSSPLATSLIPGGPQQTLPAGIQR